MDMLVEVPVVERPHQPLDWTLNEQDVLRGEELYTLERINPLTKAHLFQGALYCMLSLTQNYKMLTRIHDALVERGMATPETFAAYDPTAPGVKKTELGRIVHLTRFPTVAGKRIQGFSRWWLESDIAERIIDDVSSKREQEFAFRDEFAKDAPGVGMKCASMLLRMSGYERTVPIDLWALRYLRDMQHLGRIDAALPIIVHDYETNGAVKPADYLVLEREFSRLATEEGHQPARFQVYLWSKASQWWQVQERKEAKRKQASLFP